MDGLERDVRRAVRSFLASHKYEKVARVYARDILEEKFGFDITDKLALTGRLNRLFGISISVYEAWKLVTIGDIVDRVKSFKNARRLPRTHAPRWGTAEPWIPYDRKRTTTKLGDELEYWSDTTLVVVLRHGSFCDLERGAQKKF